MRFFVFCFLFVSCLLSCEDVNHVSVPDKLIPKDSLVNMLYDIALLNAARGYGAQKLAQYKIKPETYVFEKYKIDSLQFAKNVTYYSSIPGIYKTINDSVFSKLEKIHAVKDSLNEIEEKRKDSIRKHKIMQRSLKDSIARAKGKQPLLKLSKEKYNKFNIKGTLSPKSALKPY